MSERPTHAEWLAAGLDSGWGPPPRSGPLARLPVIRHVRTLWLTLQVARHSTFWAGMGMLDTGYDDWVLFGMWRGWA